MPDPNSIEKIYITYKARINAEARLRYLSKLLHLVITWYSFLLILLSISQAANMIEVRFSDVFFAGCSIGIFAASILTYSENLSKKADEFRECYLELQSIYSSPSSDEEKIRLYNLALRRYPNHTNKDYDDIVFENWYKGKDLRDSNGKLKPTITTGIIVVVRKILFIIGKLFLFAGPIAILPMVISFSK